MVYESVNIPLWRALQSLRGRRVLDVGCGAGALGELLEKAGNTVTGLTHSPEEARLAATRLHAVKLVDLDDPVQVEAALTETYDVILCADVLEHLRDPATTLARLLRQLAPGGLVGVSLPNIACFSTRLGLLFGRFTMSKTGGILDETHLHFYTLRTARALLTGAGLQIERIDLVPAPSVWFYQTFVKRHEAPEVNAGGMAARPLFKFYQSILYPIEHAVAGRWRTLFAHQFVFLCRRLP